MALYLEIMLKSKEHIVWFVDVKDMQSWSVGAKIKQLSDWVDRERPFGNKYDVVIIPSDENKFSILKTETDFRENFQGDPDKWLCAVKDRLEDCLTIHLSIQNSSNGG